MTISEHFARFKFAHTKDIRSEIRIKYNIYSTASLMIPFEAPFVRLSDGNFVFLNARRCRLRPKLLYRLLRAAFVLCRNIIYSRYYFIRMHAKAAVAKKLGLCYLRCIAVKGSALQ